MTVLLVILLVIAAGVLLLRAVRQRDQPTPEGPSRGHANVPAQASTSTAVPEQSLDPALAEVLRRPDRNRPIPRGAQSALRAATPEIQESLQRHRETPLLILWSEDMVSKGLLVVTSGRTLRIGPPNGGSAELVHVGARTSIRASGPRDPKPLVEIVNEGRIRFFCSSVTEAQLLCGVIDTWAESPHVTADPRVIVTPFTVSIPQEFYIDTLSAAGHPATPYNLRSIHERFGMQLHNKALKHLEAATDQATAERFIAGACRPADDRDLPDWPEHILKQWIAQSPDVAHVAAFTPHLVRTFLLESVQSDGYLSQTGAPLPMWKSDQYENDGRGPRRHTGPGQPPVPA